MVSLFALSKRQRSKLFINFRLVFLSPVNMIGGFPLSAPLEGLVMMLILCASACAWPVATLMSSCCPSIVVG